MRQRATDCIIIGHNDSDLHEWSLRTRPAAAVSGGYSEIKTNSVLFEGRRLTLMDLLNEAIAAAVGRNPGLNAFDDPQAGAYYLASYLQRRALGAEVVNSFRNERPRLQQLLADAPRAVAVATTYYVENEPLREVIDFVRQHAPGTKIVVGGPHIFNLCEDLAEADQSYVLNQLGADIYIHDSQGESTLARLVAALAQNQATDLGALPNLIFHQDGSLRRSERQTEQNGLDENITDWTSLRSRQPERSAVSLRTARSCPFSCSFCNYPTMAGSHVLASIEVVEAELRQLHELGVRHLRFIDDTFNVPLPRFKQLLRMMIRCGFDFRWVSFLRCSNTDDETYDLMRAAGCVGVLLGIESGDATILASMNKAAKPERYEYGIRRLNEVGILSCASMIVGFPGETRQTILNSMEFLDRTRPTFFGSLLYYHDRRAPIHARRQELGIQGAGYSWSHRTMDWMEAAEWVQTLYRDVKGSAPLTLHGFSMFSQPYLLAQGLSNEQLIAFCEAARPLLVRGFADESVGRDDADFQKIVQIFQPLRLAEAPCQEAHRTALASESVQSPDPHRNHAMLASG